MLACAIFPNFKLLDKPEKYKLKRKPLPYPTGIASVIAFILMFVLAQSPLSFQAKGLLFGIILLTLTSVIDDIKSLPAWARLLIQALVAFIIFAAGTRIYTITNPLGGILKLDTIDIYLPLITSVGPLPLFSGIFTIAWLLLTTNSFNWLDGIPGQVSILSFIGGLTLGLLSLSSRVDQPEIAIIAFIVAGVALGSAVFDLPPNKTVMGDTGAMFFGLMLGTISIYAGGKVATALLVMGVPLMDAVLVTIKRISKGRSPLKGGRDHLHHMLIDNRKWTEAQVILLTAVLGTSFGVSALFMSTLGKFAAIILLGIVMMWITKYASTRPLPSKKI